MRRAPTNRLLLLALALAACAHRPAELPPPVEPPAAFSRDGGAPLAPAWWTAFEAPELDALVDEALRANLDLAAAWERLRAARAVVDRRASDLLPDGSAFVDGELGYPSSEERDQLVLGLAAAYEVDLWGRIGSAVEAERLRAHATLEDYRTVAVSLSAEVVTAWLRLAEAGHRLALLALQVETNGKVLQLLEARFRSGQIRAVDVLRQRQLLEATRALAIGAEAEQQLLRHQLAVLLGRPPRAPLAAHPGALPSPPPLPAPGLPAELLQRRPDLRRAHSQLLAADRDLASAVSAQYPRLTLSARAGVTAVSATQVFEGWFVSLAANLLAPLFDPELAAEVDRTEAVKRELLYAYGQAALEALREVEDALAREDEQRRRIESLAQQRELAEAAWERLRAEYLGGVGDYLSVLTALAEAQALRRELLAARGALLRARVGLHRALAGGFETPREVQP